MTLLNIIVFGLNRFPDIALPAFDEFLGRINVKDFNILAGFIVPPDSRVDNKSSGESNVLLEDPLGSSWYSHIHHYIGAYRQDSFPSDRGYYLFETAWRASRERLDIFQNDYKSTLNYLNYLYASYKFTFDARSYLLEGPVLLLRPDILYSSSAPLSISTLGGTSILTLGYDKYSQINDRLFLSSSHNIMSIMQRISLVPRYLAPPWRYFHSECFTRWYIQKQVLGIVNYAPPSLTAKRIRSNGHVEDSDSIFYEGVTTNSLFTKNFFRESALIQLLSYLGLNKCP